jgi:hypothetical protein
MTRRYEAVDEVLEGSTSSESLHFLLGTSNLLKNVRIVSWHVFHLLGLVVVVLTGCVSICFRNISLFAFPLFFCWLFVRL